VFTAFSSTLSIITVGQETELSEIKEAARGRADLTSTAKTLAGETEPGTVIEVEAADAGTTEVIFDDVADSKDLESKAEVNRQIPEFTAVPATAEEARRPVGVVTTPDHSAPGHTVGFSEYYGIAALLAAIAVFGFMMYRRSILRKRNLPPARQALMDSALDSRLEGILVLDKGQTIVFANQSLQHIVGLSSDELIGEKAAILKGTDVDRKLFEDAETPWGRTLIDGVPQMNLNLRLGSAGSEYGVFMTDSSPLLDHLGRLAGVRVSFNHIGELDSESESNQDQEPTKEDIAASHVELLGELNPDIQDSIDTIPECAEAAQPPADVQDFEAKVADAEALASTESIARAEAEDKAESRTREQLEADLEAEVAQRQALEASIVEAIIARSEIEARAKATDDARLEAEDKASTESLAREQAEAELQVEAIQRQAAEARIEAEIGARAELEASAKAAVDARIEAEDQVKAESLARAQAETELEAEVTQRQAAEARVEAEIGARAELEASAKAAVDARIKAEEQAKAEAEARSAAEKEFRDAQTEKRDLEARLDKMSDLNAELEAKAEVDAVARTKAETVAVKQAEAREVAESKIETITRARAEVVAKIKQEANSRIEEEASKRAEAELKAERALQAQSKAEETARAESNARIEAEARAKADAAARIAIEEEAAAARARAAVDARTVGKEAPKAWNESKARVSPGVKTILEDAQKSWRKLEDKDEGAAGVEPGAGSEAGPAQSKETAQGPRVNRFVNRLAKLLETMEAAWEDQQLSEYPRICRWISKYAAGLDHPELAGLADELREGVEREDLSLIPKKLRAIRSYYLYLESIAELESAGLNEREPELQPQREKESQPAKPGVEKTQRTIRSAPPRRGRWPIRPSLNVDNPTIQKLVRKSVELLEHQLVRMDAAFAAENYAELTELCHRFRSEADSVGLLPLIRPAKELEEMVNESQFNSARERLALLKDFASRIEVGKPTKGVIVKEHVDEATASKTPYVAPVRSDLNTDDPERNRQVEQFIIQLGSRLTELHHARENNDFAEIGRISQWISRYSRVMGFAEFTQPAQELSEIADHQAQDLVPDKLDELRLLFGRIDG
jgi:PAS domain-containing protein